MAEIVLTAQQREPGSKNAARRLRTQGLIPAVVYGGKDQPQSVAVDPKTLLRVLRSESGRNTILSLDFGNGSKSSAILKAWQVDPVRENFLHADFLRIAMDVAIRVTVPVVTKGEAKGVKLDGGILEIILRSVQVECLPGDIPERIEVDVTSLGIHDAVRVSNLALGEKIKVLDDADQVVVHVISVKEETAAKPGAAGDAAAAPAEPEVAKKGKKEEEGADK